MKTLLDSDALFALYVKNDAHHQQAKKKLSQLINKKARLFVTNLVLQETTTVISYRFGHKHALNFIKHFSQTGIPQIFVDPPTTLKAWQVFKKQTRKGASFIDCANIAVYKKEKFNSIFSFDKFYQRMKVNVA